jgi:hypothetical protein
MKSVRRFGAKEGLCDKDDTSVRKFFSFILKAKSNPQFENQTSRPIPGDVLPQFIL